jgi:hypothetical protein
VVPVREAAKRPATTAATGTNQKGDAPSKTRSEKRAAVYAPMPRKTLWPSEM